MREIKFRAWDKFQEEMVSVDRINFDVEEIDVIIEKTESVENFYSCGFDEIELMQYTGLKDKNGKDIYEGDIFHLGDVNIKHIVVWHDSGFMGKQCRSSSYVGLGYWQDRIEVIGNIFENPELLEVE